MAVKGLIDEIKRSKEDSAAIQQLIYEKEVRDQELIGKFYKKCGGAPMENFLGYLKRQPLSKNMREKLKKIMQKKTTLAIDEIYDYLDLATLYSEGIEDEELKSFLLGDNPVTGQGGDQGGNPND